MYRSFVLAAVVLGLSPVLLPFALFLHKQKIEHLTAKPGIPPVQGLFFFFSVNSYKWK